jgi:hypothetical protein
VYQNSDETSKPLINTIITVINFSKQRFISQGGRVVLGRTVVLCYSSWCLNTRSCSFHLVVARKQGGRVVLGKTKSFMCASWCLYKWK